MRILIVDDDSNEREMLVRAFPTQEITEAADLHTAGERLRQAAAQGKWPDIVVLDAMFYKSATSRTRAFLAGSFLDLMEEIGDEWEEAPPEVIVVSGQDEAASYFDPIAEWLDDGRIRDVLPKSAAKTGWHIFQAILRHKAQSLIRERKLRAKISSLDEVYRSLERYGIITRAECMIQVWRDILHASQTNHNVFIHGETGTGKEHVAKAIAGEQGLEMISYDCSSLAPELSASVILGTVRGGFTDAEQKKGLIEEASDKILFLDEFFDLFRGNQALVPLLRATDEEIREYRRVGESAAQPRQVNCRFIFADTLSVFDAVREKLCSKDLVYRLAYLTIRIPPLRERRSGGESDIRLLTQGFLEEGTKSGQHKLTLAEEVYRAFDNGHWPGNVRALKRFVRLIVEKCGGGEVALEAARKAIGDEYFAQEIGDLSQTTTPIVSTSANPSVPADAAELLARLRDELQANHPAIWTALGKNPKVEEDGRPHPHEKVVRKTLKLVLHKDAYPKLAKCIKSLHARKSNAPRRINVYKVLLYLTLRHDHSATLKEFTEFLGLRSRTTWDAAAEELRHRFSEELVMRTLGKRDSKIFTLSEEVLAAKTT